jgi:hypothetical protein
MRHGVQALQFKKGTALWKKLIGFIHDRIERAVGGERRDEPRLLGDGRTQIFGESATSASRYSRKRARKSTLNKIARSASMTVVPRVSHTLPSAYHCSPAKEAVSQSARRDAPL